MKIKNKVIIGCISAFTIAIGIGIYSDYYSTKVTIAKKYFQSGEYSKASNELRHLYPMKSEKDLFDKTDILANLELGYQTALIKISEIESYNNVMTSVFYILILGHNYI